MTEKDGSWLSNDSSRRVSKEDIDEKYSFASPYASKRPTPNIVEQAPRTYSTVAKILLRISPFAYVVAQAASVFYLYTRCNYIIEASRETGQKFVSAWLFFAFEALLALWTCEQSRPYA